MKEARTLAATSLRGGGATTRWVKMAAVGARPCCGWKSGRVPDARPLLLVDAANVVGSRPTGWWRDRPGAARRLVEALRAATADGHLAPPVVVVLEGAARPGAPEGDDGAVEVVHADGSGDDELARLAAERAGAVTLVSADRQLRRRVEAAGGRCMGPRWLLDRLDGG